MAEAPRQKTITEYVQSEFQNIHVDTSTDDTFFFAGSGRKFPFATIVTSDNDFDNFSNLDRPSVFRLSIGIGKSTFQSLFPSTATKDGANTTPSPEYDFTALDQILPHPIYGHMYWLCVLNPSHETFQRLRPLIQEAHDLQMKRSSRA